MGSFVAPIYKIKMKPCFMMTTLIIRSQVESFVRDGEGTMFVHFPKALRTRLFEKSTDVCTVVRNGSLEFFLPFRPVFGKITFFL